MWLRHCSAASRSKLEEALRRGDQQAFVAGAQTAEVAVQVEFTDAAIAQVDEIHAMPCADHEEMRPDRAGLEAVVVVAVSVQFDAHERPLAVADQEDLVRYASGPVQATDTDRRHRVPRRIEWAAGDDAVHAACSLQIDCMRPPSTARLTPLT